MTRSRSKSKPPELRISSITPGRVKNLVKNVRRISGGLIYVYQWNSENAAAPLCLFIDPSRVEVLNNILESLGASKSVLQHGCKFALSTVTAFEGFFMEVYETGRIIVKWAKVSPSNSPGFAETAFLELLEPISRKINNAKETNETNVENTESVADENWLIDNDSAQRPTLHGEAWMQAMIDEAPDAVAEDDNTAVKQQIHEIQRGGVGGRGGGGERAVRRLAAERRVRRR